MKIKNLVSVLMRVLPTLNLVLVGAILCVIGLFFFTRGGEDILSFSSLPEKIALPASPFAQPEEIYHEIGEGPLSLKWEPPHMQLPDLRNECLFYGKNGRPDQLPGNAYFHLSLKRSSERKLIQEKGRIYLVYQGSYSPPILEQSHCLEPISATHSPLWGEVSRPQEKGHYLFSPDNQPTPLWLEILSHNEQSVEVQVSMLDEKGAVVTTPSELRTFTLQVQDFPKADIVGWDLGGYRVDTTLLVRQKARWIGSDLFLELYGGDEYSHAVGKERIDFLDGELPYSCFVKAGDFLIWKDNRWEVVNDFNQTQNLPLMIVKKIDEKIMAFEVWDPEGKGKTLLSLIRAKDHNQIPNLSQEFKFVGAKTWAQFIVECRNGGRMTLKPYDWLVLTQDGWIKLNSPEQIDDFVEQRISGPLFILEKMIKQQGRQALIGQLFNTSRTEVEQIELTASSNPSLANFYRNIPTSPPIKLNEGGEE